MRTVKTMGIAMILVSLAGCVAYEPPPPVGYVSPYAVAPYAGPYGPPYPSYLWVDPYVVIGYPWYPYYRGFHEGWHPYYYRGGGRGDHGGGWGSHGGRGHR